MGEVERLAPAALEWEEINAEHQRLAHAQSLIDAARGALDAVSDAEVSAAGLTRQAAQALADAAHIDERLKPIAGVLQDAQAQLDDAGHSLAAYLQHTELDPDRLSELDARLSAWIGLARRLRRPPEELAAQLVQWRAELAQLDAAADAAALEHAAAQAEQAWRTEAGRVSAARRAAAPRLAGAVTQAMQQLGMAGGSFEVGLLAQDEPQSFGLESVELRVAGHAGSTPRPLAKVASGGELSRLALAISVSAARGNAGAGAPGPRGDAAATLIFDEVDAGIGGAVADTVGRLMKQLGVERQVLAVTHLAQVAACGDHHFVVSKRTQGLSTESSVRPVLGEERVAEVARMLGGERLATSSAHAQELIVSASAPPGKPRRAKR
jgi:DNA repair protein RecN (Recombination protein N)